MVKDWSDVDSLRRDLSGPKGEVVRINGGEFAADGGDMVDQAQVFQGVMLGRRRWVDVETWEWEDSRPLPLLNGCLDFRGPHQIRLVRTGRPVFWDWHVIVRAANLVLGAIATLREVLVTSNMSTLAEQGLAQQHMEPIARPNVPSVTSLARLGVTRKNGSVLLLDRTRWSGMGQDKPPSWRATAGTGHCKTSRIELNERTLCPS
jgi:hypothetical protein